MQRNISRLFCQRRRHAHGLHCQRRRQAGQLQVFCTSHTPSQPTLLTRSKNTSQRQSSKRWYDCVLSPMPEAVHSSLDRGSASLDNLGAPAPRIGWSIRALLDVPLYFASNLHKMSLMQSLTKAVEYVIRREV